MEQNNLTNQYVCTCNFCGDLYIDTNPKNGAKKYPVNEAVFKVLEDHRCPDCGRDDNLCDNFNMKQLIKKNYEVKLVTANILKIVDLEHTQVSEKTLAFLDKVAIVAWKDMHLKEDIYNVDDVIEQFKEDEDYTDEAVLKELDAMLTLVTTEEASYLRIIYI